MADGDAEQNELTNRMRACYLRIADNRYLPGGHQGPPNVYVVMTALAEEVRAYDREQWPTNERGERLHCPECRGPSCDGYPERVLDA